MTRHFGWSALATLGTILSFSQGALAASPEVPSVLKVLPSDTAGVWLVNTERKAWESLAQFQLFPVDITVPGMVAGGLLPGPERYSMRSAQSGQRPLAVMNFYVDVLPWLGDRVAYASLPDGSFVTVAAVGDASKVQPFLDRLTNSRPERPTQLTYSNAQIIAWAPKPLAKVSAPKSRVNARGGTDTQLEFVPDKVPAKVIEFPASGVPVPAEKKPPTPPMTPGFALAYLPGPTGHVMVAPTVDVLKNLLDRQKTPSLSLRPDLQKTIADPRFASALFVGFGDFADVFSVSQKSPSNTIGRAMIKPLAMGDRDIQAMLRQVYGNLEGFVWATPEGLSAEGSLALTPMASKVLTDLFKKSEVKGQVLKQIPAVTYGLANSSVPPFLQPGLSALSANKQTKPFLDNVRNSTKGFLGFDDRDFLPWINGEFAMFAFPTEQGFFAKQLGTDLGIGLLIQTSDRPLAEASLKKIQEGIIKKIGNGAKVGTHTVNQTPFVSVDNADGKSFLAYSWVSADTVLIVSGAETSDRLVPKPWNPITESPAFKEAIAPLPKENIGYFYLDGSATAALVFNSIVPKLFAKEVSKSASAREFQASASSIRHIVATSALSGDRLQTMANIKLGRVARPIPTVTSLLEKYKPGSEGSMFPGAQGITDMSRAIALDPKVGEPYFQRGQMRLFDSDYAGALEDFEAAAARNVKPNLLSKYKASANYYLHNYEKAIVDLEQTIAIVPAQNIPEETGLIGLLDIGLPDRPETLLFKSYMQLGRYQEASSFISKQIPTGPIKFDFHYETCAAKARLGDLKAASEDCKAGLAAELEKQEGYSKTFEKNIVSQIKAGTLTEAAAADKRKRRATEFKLVPARCYVGAALGEATALQECEKAIAINPKNAEAYEYLGLGRAALKQTGTAKQAYGQAIALYETMGNQVAVKRVEALLKLLK
jgi:tetratricopeptide (TPR) repeat protein